MVEQVVPEMLEKGDGAILFTTGLSALYPMQFMGSVGIALAGLRNYVMNLHANVANMGYEMAEAKYPADVTPATIVF